VVEVIKQPLSPRKSTPVPNEVKAEWALEPIWKYLEMRKSPPTRI
jgi:hypothetical protein